MLGDFRLNQENPKKSRIPPAMKPFRSLLADARRNRGLALIIVLSMLALATIVILAFLSIADTEHKATVTYSSSQTSRRLADTAVNMVVAQIRAGSQRENETEPVIHATQPGAVRKYNSDGVFIGGYKLFSDKDMVFRAPVAGADNVNQYEEQFVQDSEPPGDWNIGPNIARYVDINEPVVKGVLDASGKATQTQVYFPVLDPRAAQDVDQNTGDDVPVEGFFYMENTALKNQNLAQASTTNPQQRPIVLPGTAGGSLDDLRLAMPVQWLYILRDGAVGYLNDNLEFNVLNGSAGGMGQGTDSAQDAYGVPSETNPIVGRVAFWTDDETCKVNINTASEPTYTGQPLYYHERDQSWADFPPARGEYQRFPGHPATVALSSVLYPNPLQTDERSLDTYGPRGRISGAALTRALAVKERLYDLIPRIHTGGSLAGTRAFAQDDYRTLSGDSTNSDAVAIQQAANERLYASVDELLFAQTVSGSRRVLNNANAGGLQLFTRDSLERSSAFLTAHSRASEINMYGLPRIAMWPIAESPERRTGFDNLIEFCSRLGSASNSYIFQRAYSRTIPPSVSGPSYDVNIARNQRLLNMLDKLLAKRFPGSTFVAGPGDSYVEKYGQDNARQLIVQFFDYIRSTNLYDSYLVPKNRNDWPAAAINWNNATTGLYIVRDRERPNWKTYTDGVVRDTANINKPWNDRFLPGHGQVTPAEWTIGGKTYRGFGRFVSISEIGLQFICTADGQPDMYSWRIPMKNTAPDAEPNDYRIPLEGEDDLNLINYVDYLADSNNTPNVSGGRTALEIDETLANTFGIQSMPLSSIGMDDFNISNLSAVHWQGSQPNSIKSRYYSNFPPLNQYRAGGLYNTSTDSAADPMRNPIRHPGYRPENWNHTLDEDTPLAVNEKRVQALLHLEFFCPSVGYSIINPDMTIVISSNDISNIQVSTIRGPEAVFSTTENVVIRTEKPLYDMDGTPEVGGFATFRKIAQGRRVKTMRLMPEDVGYDTNATSSVHSGLINLDLVSSFFTVNRDEPLQFSSGTITVNIYDTHDWQSAAPVQTVRFRLDPGQAPAPDLITMGSYKVEYTRTDGTLYHHPPLQAPRWWGFHRDGVLGRSLGVAPRDTLRGRFNRDYPGYAGGTVSTETRAVDSSTGGMDPMLPTVALQSVPGARALIYGRDSGNYAGVRLVAAEDAVNRIRYGPNPVDPQASWDRPWHFGSDTVRTLQPAHGDARLFAARKVIEANEWTPHRKWNDANEFIAHNFSSYTAGNEPGFDYGLPNTSNDSVASVATRPMPLAVTLTAARHPDAPHALSSFSPTGKSASELIQRYYDFDDSDPGGRVGPFINKPDEGNYSIGEYKPSGWPAAKVWRGTYFRSNSQSERFAAGQGSFFTPNRMISSPVMFGSLPSRVWDNGGGGAWTNLLFRPHVAMDNGITRGHPSEAIHPGETTPPDHYLLDLFWMPVVEPYAISESLSTAGKINMNYQMLPFTHIRRATALHALMKGEVFAALPNAEYNYSKDPNTGWGTNGSTAPIMNSESRTLKINNGSARNNNAYWHRTIAIDRFKPLNGADQRWWEIAVGQRVQGTLRQFEERFNFGRGPTAPGSLPSNMRAGLFRSASQICELHLIPNPVPGGTAINVSASDVNDIDSRQGAMRKFWSEHCSTGDNTRERPYSNLYARLTTRSNTFRVHVRAQAIRKSLRSVAPNRFDPNHDLMTGEFRGSFLVERYIDQGDLQRAGAAVDFASASDPFALKPLENYYRFRILESKRFAP
jgi:uncharacterized protein (TIGR02600 family)